MKSEKDLLFEVPEGSGKFYKREDLNLQMQPYDDAVVRDADGSEIDSTPGTVYLPYAVTSGDQFFINDGANFEWKDLTVTGDVTISGDTKIDSDKLNVDVNGNVGNGVPNPTASLDVSPWPKEASDWARRLTEEYYPGVSHLSFTYTIESSQSKKIVYVRSMDAYYYAEDLMPTGIPYSDARPLSHDHAERLLREENESDTKGTGTLLDLF